MPIFDSVRLVRPRVNKLLEQAARYPLVTVCAGTGYGKTQAVGDFCREAGGKTIWIQLTKRDNNEGWFWEKVVHSAFQKTPDLESELLSAGMPKTDPELARYFTALADTFNSWTQYGRIYTVFDDLHAADNPDVLRFIREVVRFMAPKRTLMLLSRTYPFPDLTGPIAKEAVPLISEEDLLFTEEEVAEYLRLLGVSVSTRNVRRAMDGTKGWPLALGIVGQTLQRTKGSEDSIVGAVEVNINKVMEAEIQEAVSARLKKLLVRLSLLDNLPAELVYALADEDDGFVAELEKCNAYVRYDMYKNAYIVNTFFLHRLRQHHNALAEDEKRAVYREAGQWCARNGYVLDAVNYYEKALDYETLIRLVYRCIDKQIPHDIAPHILAVLENAPPEAIHGIPLFQRLHLRLLLSMGRLTEMLAQAEAYEKRYLEQPETPETTRAIAELNYSMGIACQLLSTFTDRYDFYRFFLRQDLYFSKNPYQDKDEWQPSLFIGSWVTTVGTERAGALDEYIATLEKCALALIHARGGFGAGKIAIARGEVCFYQGKWKEAEQYLQDGIREAREQNQYDLWNCALFYRLRLCLLRGDEGEAECILRDMKNLLSEERYPARYSSYDIYIGWYFLRINQPQRIPDWLKTGFSPYAHAKFIENSANQIKALYRYLSRDYAALLAFAAEKRRRESIVFERLEMQAMEACALYLSKDKDAAFVKLREAYETALPGRLVTPFSELGKDMRTLTAAALKRGTSGIPGEWLEEVSRHSATYAKRLSGIAADFCARNRLETEISLSRREKEILTELSHGLTRAEIAAKLGISTNTIKLIIHSLYGKLGAGNVADAIRIGLDKKLI